MHRNIFVNPLIAVFLAFVALSCTPNIDIDEPAGRIVSIAPSDNGRINLTLVCKSNITDFLKVNYRVITPDRIAVTGHFSTVDSTSFSWAPDSTSIKLGLLGEKVHDFSVIVFDRPEGVYFNVMARLTTPTDGVELNWGALYGQKFNGSLSLWNKTLTALNTGLSGQTPGTGTDRHIVFRIEPNKYGKYGISVDWTAGGLLGD